MMDLGIIEYGLWLTLIALNIQIINILRNFLLYNRKLNTITILHTLPILKEILLS